MLTLRPDPSQESKCHPNGLLLLAVLSSVFMRKPLTKFEIHIHLICFSLPSPVGAIGVSMATTAGRRSICSRHWSPPIRRPSSLTWRALIALCPYPSLTAPPHLPRRVWSKNHDVLPVVPSLFSHPSCAILPSIFPLSYLRRSPLSHPPSFSLSFSHLFAVIDWRKPLMHLSCWIWTQL